VIAWLLAACLLSSIQAATSGGAVPLTLDQAMEIALAANPTLAAAKLGRDIAKARLAVAGERPNPELSFEETKETPRDALSLAFPIELGSKRHRRVDLAEAEGRSNEAEITRVTAETRNLLRRAFFGLAAAQRRAGELEELSRLAERTRGAARNRFEAGAAPRLELLQAELAASDTANAAREARALLVSARAELNTVLAHAPDDPVAAEEDFDSGVIPEADAATALAVGASAELAVLDGQIAEATARVALARAQRIPDPVLVGAVTHRSEPEFDWGWRAGVGITLPILTTHRATVAAEESALTQLQAHRVALKARIQGDVYGAVALAASQKDHYSRFRDEMLPRATEVERMAEDAYRSGQTGLVAMLQALQMTRDLRIRAVQAALDYQISLADLERAMGAPLP